MDGYSSGGATGCSSDMPAGASSRPTRDDSFPSTSTCTASGYLPETGPGSRFAYGAIGGASAAMGSTFQTLSLSDLICQVTTADTDGQNSQFQAGNTAPPKALPNFGHPRLFPRTTTPAAPAYVPKEHTMTESINNPCFEAALSEKINFKSQSKVSANSSTGSSKLKSLKTLKERPASTAAEQAFRRKALLGKLKQTDIASLRAKLQQHQQSRVQHKFLETQEALLKTGSILCNPPSTVAKSVEEALPYRGTESNDPVCSVPSIVVHSPPVAEVSTESIQQQDLPSNTLKHSLKMKSFQLNANPNMKKYRYNQTALALHQSGLMKTTVKTADLLRKSRLLQKELLKLRQETTMFVHSVLSNPENEHLRASYAHLLPGDFQAVTVTSN